MALQATFTANFEQFQTALTNASAALTRDFEVPVKGLQASLTNLAKDFSGANIISQAEKMAAAVQAAGGAAVLTEKEQARVNATVVEAIAKYAALGQQAPDALKELAEQTKKADDAGKGWSFGLATISTAVGNLASNAITSLVSGMGQSVGKILEMGGQLTDLSSKTGISTTALQQMQYAASQSGVQLETVTGAVTKMGIKLAGGDEGAAAAAKKLGLSFEDLRGMSPEQAFYTITDAVKGVEDPMAQSKLMVDLFGKSGTELLPVINDAGGGFSAMAQKASELGLVMSEDTIAAADELGDTWDVLKTQGMALLANLLAPFVPMIVAVANTLVSFAQTAMPYVTSGLDLLMKGFYLAKAGIADFIATILEAAQKIPFLGEKLGLAAGGADYFRKMADDARKALAEMNTTTDLGVDKVPKLRGAVLDLGKAGEDAAKQTAAHAKELDKLTGQDRITAAEGLRKQIDELGGASALTASQMAPIHKTMLEAIQVVQERGAAVPQWMQDIAFATGAAKTKIDLFAISVPTIMQNAATLEGLDAILLNNLPTNEQTTATIQAAMTNVPTVIEGSFVAGAAKAKSTFGAEFGKDLGTNIMAAITGGGDVGDAIGATIGNSIGEKLSSSLGGKLTSGLTSTLGESLGGTIGGALNSILPGIGSLLGMGLGKIFDGIFKSAEKAANDTRDAFIASAGGIDALNVSASKAGVTLTGLLDAKKPEALKAEMEKLKAAIEAHKQALADLDADLTKTLSAGSLLTQDLIGQMDKLFAQDRAGAEGSIFKFLQGEIQQVTEGFNVAAKSWGESLTGGVAGFDRLGMAAVAAFEAAKAGGASVPQALALIKPGLDALSEAAIKVGGTGSAAFGELARWSTLSGQFAPLLEQVSGLDKMMVALGNTGLLTQETFTALSDQVGVTFQTMVAQGATADEAMRLMQPQLQHLWELENQFGVSTQGATSDLLNQAFASGQVGDQFTSDQARMTKAVSDLVGRIDTMLQQVFGIPAATATAASGMSDAFDGVRSSRAQSAVSAVSGKLGALGPEAQTAAGAVNAAMQGVVATPAESQIGRVQSAVASIGGFAYDAARFTNDALARIDSASALGELDAIGGSFDTLPAAASDAIGGVNDAFQDIAVSDVQDAVHDIDWEFATGIPDAAQSGVDLVNTEMGVAGEAVGEVSDAALDVAAVMTSDIPEAADRAKEAIGDLSNSAVSDFGEMEDAAGRVSWGSSPTGIKEIWLGAAEARRALRDLRDTGADTFGDLEGRAGRVLQFPTLSRGATGAFGSQATVEQRIVVQLDGRTVAAVVARNLPAVLRVAGAA